MNQTRRDFVRTLFVATQAVVASPFLPGTLRADEPAKASYPGNFNFLVFGDWGRKGQWDQRDVAKQMGVAAKDSKARFVISVGDNFYDFGVASITDPQWESSFQTVYNAPALQIPWHAVLGNHDYNGNCDAQIEYTKLGKRWNMPARYFTQTHALDAATSADFFYLDTSPLIKAYHANKRKLGEHVNTQDSQKQLDWFAAQLAASKAKWKIVIAHHPIYSGGEHGDSKDLIQDLLPLLQKYKVHAYFNGHDHDLQHLVAGDVNLFCTGAGSLTRGAKTTDRTKFTNAQPGFTTVSLQPDAMTIQMINSSGKMLYRTVVPAKAG